MEGKPPFFCAATKTPGNFAETPLKNHLLLPPHPMEQTIKDFPQQDLLLDHPETTISTNLEVYIDDFITMVCQSNDSTHFRQVARHLLHTIDISGNTSTFGTFGPIG